MSPMLGCERMENSNNNGDVQPRGSVRADPAANASGHRVVQRARETRGSPTIKKDKTYAL